ncbi:MerR family DNA-binding protein [Saccharothrix deserti]|uniref:MerR family DNA-binding protein n=1 Tax=Saccharothrix deserti TaxID=2593674 RepID=UPI00131CB4B3|nr:MerR family DNA-binding protein [Saccharothrix deserti]
MAEDLLSIDKVAKESGLASSALRYYERCGLIGPVVKIQGRRHYSRSVLHRLSVIKVCQSVGFSLTEIACLLDGDGEQDNAWKALAAQRRRDIERQIGTLQSLLATLDSALDCSCPQLIKCPEMGPHGELATRATHSRLELTERRPSWARV